MSDEREQHPNLAHKEVAIFGDKIRPLPALVDQDHWDLLRLAGTLDEKRKHIFLRVLAETANSKLACQSAGYRNMAAITRALKNDPSFMEAYKEAAEAAAEFIEAEAVRRAVQGVKKAVYFKGEIIDYEVVYSDTLLAILLKAAKPDKFADRSKHQTDINVRVGVAVVPPSAKNVRNWEQQSESVHAAQRALNGPEKIVDAEFKEVDDAGLKRGG
jgi:hypothetical protein